MFRLDPVKSSNKFIISTLLIFVFSTFFIWLGYKNHKLKNFIYIFVCFLIFIVIAFFTLSELNWNPRFKAHQPYQVFGIIFASILSTIIITDKIK